MNKLNLQDQVCSYKLAKRLKDLGVTQESLFHWITYTKCYESPKAFYFKVLTDLSIMMATQYCPDTPRSLCLSWQRYYQNIFIHMIVCVNY